MDHVCIQDVDLREVFHLVWLNQFAWACWNTSVNTDDIRIKGPIVIEQTKTCIIIQVLLKVIQGLFNVLELRLSFKGSCANQFMWSCYQDIRFKGGVTVKHA